MIIKILAILTILLFTGCATNHYYIMPEEELSIWDLEELACDPTEDDCEY